MLKNIKKSKLIITTLITAAPILVGLLLWDKLPAELVTHWGVDGEPNGWTPKLGAVVGIPLFLVAMHWFCIACTLADPKWKQHSPKIMNLIFWICPIVSIFCMGSILGTALGIEMSVEKLAPLLTGFLLIYLGNYLPKCQHNYTVGIRLPWTLGSEENWNRTHRFAGPIWVLAGALFIIFGFLDFIMLATITIFAAVLIPSVYSYLYYAKYERDQ